MGFAKWRELSGKGEVCPDRDGFMAEAGDHVIGAKICGRVIVFLSSPTQPPRGRCREARLHFPAIGAADWSA